MKYYKVLRDNQAKDGGSFDYSPYLPKGKRKGKWLPVIKDLALCKRGYHLTTKPTDWLGGGANQVWLVEVKPGVKVKPDSDGKFVVSTFRFISLVETNTGVGNTGLCNSGDWNSGHRNSGDGNSSDGNSGHCNSGHSNSGHCNSGHSNSGLSNSGDWNSGHRNSGDGNSGDWNSGLSNSGHCNSGDWNSGLSNSGHWNSCSHETGFFNSKQDKYVRVFNKKCLRSTWALAEKPGFLYFDLTEWVEYSKEEMEADPKKELIGGYLKTLEYKEAFKQAFKKASKSDVELLLNLPNFDYLVFEDISGISKKMIKEKLR